MSCVIKWNDNLINISDGGNIIFVKLNSIIIIIVSSCTYYFITCYNFFFNLYIYCSIRMKQSINRKLSLDKRGKNMFIAWIEPVAESVWTIVKKILRN